MSTLNWRCCAKNLKRYKKSVDILIRGKFDREDVHKATYWNDSDEVSFHDGIVLRDIKRVDLINYEYVTVGEL